MNLRRVWIVAMLVGAALMGLAYFQHARRPAKSPDANAAADANKRPEADTAPSSGPAAAPAPAAATAPVDAASSRVETRPEAASTFTLGSLEPDSGYPFRVQVVPEGAAVASLELTGYFASVADKQLAARYPHDHARYKREADQRPDQYGGNYRVLAPVEFGGVKYLPLATRWIKVWLPGESAPVGWDMAKDQWRLLDGPTINADGSQTIRFQWYLKDPNRGDPEAPAWQRVELSVVKTYTVRKGDYSLGMSLEVINESNIPVKVQIEQYGPTGVPRDEGGMDAREVVIGKVQDAGPKVIHKAAADLPKMTLGELVPVGYSRELEGRRALWIGQANKYFGSILYPVPPDPNGLGWQDPWLQFTVAAALEGADSRTYLTCATIGIEERNGRRTESPVVVAPGGTLRADFDVFAGPKKRDLLSDEEAHPLYSKLNYLGTIQFGAPCCGFDLCTFSWLTLVMMWLLEFFSKTALGNYGIAIILLVILVRVLLFPLTRKGQVMMAKGQKLGPAIEKLKIQYKDDKDALQKAMMGLYKQQGFTPLLGCLPMMLQMPIWIALWSALSAAVELRHAAFLPVWLTDLSAPDALFHLPFAIPLLGWHDFNLLPLLGCVSTFIQMKYTPQAAPATTPEQARQQALMKYMMPVMMVFFFYTMPSGLNLYIMASGLLAAGEQYFIRQHIQKKEEREAERVTTVEVSSRGFRSSRTKKPKGPHWFKQG